MGKGCDCSHCPGCGDVAEEPKKKAVDPAVDPKDPEAEEVEEVDLGDDDFLDEEEDELE